MLRLKCNVQWFSITEFKKKTLTREKIQTLKCPVVKKDLNEMYVVNVNSSIWFTVCINTPLVL